MVRSRLALLSLLEVAAVRPVEHVGALPTSGTRA